MLILGKSSDDKGTQLENLTHSILSKLGFTNIVLNEIRNGGEEIDVSAEIEFPGIKESQRTDLICECKAYKNLVDMNAWLKFLGKLFTAEKYKNQTVYGYFVALNGVNGNVAGHYKGLLDHHVNTITLVTGEELLKHVSTIYTLCDLKIVKQTIQKLTKRQVVSFEEIAYYENQVFRIVTFEANSYTILRGDGQPITKEVFNSVLKDAVKLALPAIDFIDLQEEAEAIKKVVRTQKFVISQLFLSNGTLTRNSVCLDEFDEFTVQEVNDAIETLCQQTWLKQSDDSEILFLENEDSPRLYTVLAEIYRFFLGGEINDLVLKALESEYHVNHINESFLSEIQRIQGGLLLAPEEVEQVVLLLRWSPTALAWSLYPNELLVNFSTQITLVDSNIQQGAYLASRNYFLSSLYTLFKNDFFTPEFYAHFYTGYDLREIETLQKLIVKSSTKIEFQGELKLREVLIPLDKSYINSEVDQLVRLIAFDSSPQPWEFTIESTKESFES
jgi:hypothetical protein